MRYKMSRSDFELDLDAGLAAAGVSGVFGRSGAGKTTLLRCIAGLDDPDTGTLAIGSEILQDSDDRVDIAVHRRQIGYVFQEPRLFPHLDVAGNLKYGYKRANGRQGPRFDEVIDLLDLAPLLQRRSGGLSGGEAQRVAIGRALLCAPRLLLMDEPVAALDASRKADVLPFISRVQTSFAVPILYVSHNIDEICQLCDELLIIEDGRSLACGDLQDVLLRTDLPVLAGEEAGAVIVATVESCDSGYGLSTAITTAGPLQVRGEYAPGSKVRLRLRANDVSLCREMPMATSILNTLPAKVVRIQPEPVFSVLVHLEAAGERLIARITRRSCDDLKLEAGNEVVAQIKSVSVRGA